MRIKESERISGRETACIVINLVIFKLFTFMPSVYSENAGTAAAISAVCSGAAALAVLWVFMYLYKRYGEINIVSTADKLLGRAGRYVVGAVAIIYLVTAATFALTELSGLIKMIAFPTAPLWFVQAFIVTAAVVAATRGRSGIVRTHLIIVPTVLAVTVIVIASVFSDADFSNVFPIMGLGADGILSGGAKGLVFYTDIILLFLLEPYCADQKRLRRSGFCAAVISVLAVCLFVFVYSVLVPYPASAEGGYPVYTIMKSVYYGRFLQRADAVYMLFILLSGMLYLATVISFVPKTFKASFDGVESRGYVLLAGIVVFLFAQSRTYFSALRSFWGISVTGGVFFVAILLVLLGRVFGGRIENEAM